MSIKAPDSAETHADRICEFTHSLVADHALSDEERARVDIFAPAPAGHGTRGYGPNKYGFPIGWWVHPERYKIEMKFLLEQLDLDYARKLLSVGCGPAFHELAIALAYPDMEVIATDLDPREIETAQKIAAIHGNPSNLTFRVTDAQQLSGVSSFPAIDRVMSMAALHDVPNLASVFQRLYRLCRDNTRVVITHNPDRRAIESPRAPAPETMLEPYFIIEHKQPLITSDIALACYGEIENRSRRERHYGLRQDAIVVRPRT